MSRHLLVEECLQAPVNALGQLKPREIRRHLDLQLDLCAHTVSLSRPSNRDHRRLVQVLDEEPDEPGSPPRGWHSRFCRTAASTRIVVLNACYSQPQADAVRSVVDCVVGMAGAIHDDAARSFAVGFYRALGNRRSVGNAVDQAVAALAAKGMPDEVLPAA